MLPDPRAVPTVEDDASLWPERMPSLTYRVAGGRITGQVDGLEALKQAVTKRLMTERYAHSIYSDHYGLQTVDLIGREFGYVAGALEKRIKETLLEDDRIFAVTDLAIRRGKDSVSVSFTVDGLFGKFTDQLAVVV